MRDEERAVEVPSLRWTCPLCILRLVFCVVSELCDTTTHHNPRQSSSMCNLPRVVRQHVRCQRVLTHGEFAPKFLFLRVMPCMYCSSRVEKKTLTLNRLSLHTKRRRCGSGSDRALHNSFSREDRGRLFRPPPKQRSTQIGL